MVAGSSWSRVVRRTFSGRCRHRVRTRARYLVHVEGCQVHVGPHGVIESTGSAHEPSTPSSCDGIDDNPGVVDGEVFRSDKPDSSSACVEIWGRHIIIDKGAQINADTGLSGGSDGVGWIDILAEQDIVLNGPDAARYAVHSNGGGAGVGTDDGRLITVKAKNSFINMTGKALQADSSTDGPGGKIVVEWAGT